MLLVVAGWGDGTLFVVTVRNESDQLVLVAPWYLHRSRTRGKEIRFLGSGKVCSDYASLAVGLNSNPTDDIAALVAWLQQQNSWECINLEGSAKSDPHISLFVELMEEQGFRFYQRSEARFWRLALPQSYSEFVDTRPKKTRQKLRKVERETLSDSQFVLCKCKDDVPSYLDDFRRMHVARHREIHGHDGCFEDESIGAFLQTNILRLLDDHRLWLGKLTINDQVAAACIAFQRNDTLFYYQTAFDPALAKYQPGWLQNIHLIQNCIDRDLKAIDFLRGDEPYKSRLGAEPVDHERLRAVSRNPAAQLRFSLWTKVHALKDSFVTNPN